MRHRVLAAAFLAAAFLAWGAAWAIRCAIGTFDPEAISLFRDQRSAR